MWTSVSPAWFNNYQEISHESDSTMTLNFSIHNGNIQCCTWMLAVTTDLKRAHLQWRRACGFGAECYRLDAVPLERVKLMTISHQLAYVISKQNIKKQQLTAVHKHRVLGCLSSVSAMVSLPVSKSEYLPCPTGSSQTLSLFWLDRGQILRAAHSFSIMCWLNRGLSRGSRFPVLYLCYCHSDSSAN